MIYGRLLQAGVKILHRILELSFHIREAPRSNFGLRANYPAWRTIPLFYNTFITILYIFQQRFAHHQEVNCINTSSGIVTLSRWLSGMQHENGTLLLNLHTGRHLERE